MRIELIDTQILEDKVVYIIEVDNQEVIKEADAELFQQELRDNPYSHQVAADDFKPRVPSREELENDRKRFWQDHYEYEILPGLKPESNLHPTLEGIMNAFANPLK